jgi:hypothetical protein
MNRTLQLPYHNDTKAKDFMDNSASGKVDLVAVDEDDELYNAIANAFYLSYWQNDEFNVQLDFNGKTNFGRC